MMSSKDGGHDNCQQLLRASHGTHTQLDQRCPTTARMSSSAAKERTGTAAPRVRFTSTSRVSQKPK